MTLSRASIALAVTTTTAAASMSVTNALAPTTNTTSRQLRDGCLLGHNIDFIGNDLTNVKASTSDKCCRICRNTGKCGAFTWTNFEGGTCWLKTAWGDSKISIGADSCWMPNTGQSLGQTIPKCDMPGNDLYAESGKKRTACAITCTDNAACKAVTWTNYNGGTCWYKRDVRECVPNDGAESTVVFSTFVSL